MNGKLRFGIVYSGGPVFVWQAQALRHLIDGGAAELASVIVDERQAQPKPSLLWRIFSKVCRPRALRRESISEAIAGIETANRQDLVAARAQELDFVVCFTPLATSGELHVRARFGIWSFRFGDERSCSLPPCLGEFNDAESTISGALTRLTAAASERVVLREGRLRAIEHRYGWTVDKLCFEVAKWPAYVANELAQGLTSKVEAAPVKGEERAQRSPSNFETLKLVWNIAKNVVRRLVERNRTEEWNIGVARMSPAELLRGIRPSDVCWLPPIAGGWAADPMALCTNGTVAVLCEEMQLSTGKGRIATTSFDGSSWSSLETAIATRTHSSYPYLFRYGGDIYCVPETFEAGEIALYRARKFPTDWERVTTLVDGLAAVDTTIFQHDGLFWLFCTTIESTDAVLYAFFAEEITKPWRPHAANPVKIDVCGSRPAGAPFRVDGFLYRPAQDSSRTYGGRVVVQRVVILSPTEFREEPCAVVEPCAGSPYDRGLHTISFAGEYCVIDGKRWSRRR